MINNNQPVVTMSGVSKQFLDTVASNNVTFNLYGGEICALLGENGAGKTTLMNILFGYYTCDEGQIFIKGEKVNLSAPKDAITRGVAMIHRVRVDFGIYRKFHMLSVSAALDIWHRGARICTLMGM